MTYRFRDILRALDFHKWLTMNHPNSRAHLSDRNVSWHLMRPDIVEQAVKYGGVRVLKNPIRKT